MEFTDTNTDITTLPARYRGPFARWRKHVLVPIEERFWKYVKKGDPDECWPFNGQRNKGGYGVFDPVRNHIKRMLAHRMAWTISIGKIKEGMHICHKCDNPPCCNPAHLFEGNDADNILDCVKKGRQRHRKGSAHQFAILNERLVVQIRDLYDTGHFTYQELGNMFGVSKPCISSLMKGGKNWKHLP